MLGDRTGTDADTCSYAPDRPSCKLLKAEKFLSQGIFVLFFRCLDPAAELFFREVGTLPLVYVGDGVIDRCKFLFGPYRGYPFFDGFLVCALHLIEHREVVLALAPTLGLLPSQPQTPL